MSETKKKDGYTLAESMFVTGIVVSTAGFLALFAMGYENFYELYIMSGLAWVIFLSAFVLDVAKHIQWKK